MFGLLSNAERWSSSCPYALWSWQRQTDLKHIHKDSNTTKHTNHQVREGSAYHRQTAQTHLHNTCNINAIRPGLTQGLLSLTLTPLPIRLKFFLLLLINPTIQHNKSNFLFLNLKMSGGQSGQWLESFANILRLVFNWCGERPGICSKHRSGLLMLRPASCPRFFSAQPCYFI